MKCLKILLLLGGVAVGQLGYAQKTENTPAPTPGVDHSYKPLTLKLNEDGSKYVRFIVWGHFWTRIIQANPDTRNVEGESAETIYDMGLRRARMLAYAQISPRFLILTHFGINNQTFINGGVPAGAATGNSAQIGAGSAIGISSKKPQLFFHDIWTEYMIVKNKLYIGTGLHYWNGISRSTNGSTLNFFAIDAPIFNWPLIDLTDQFARQFGVYAKGTIGKVQYRVALNKPFSVGSTASQVAANNISVNIQNDRWATQGYFSVELLDKESNLLPFYAGSYLGAKKVFNIGFGWHHHPQSLAYREPTATAATKKDMLLLGLDAYLDMPVNKEKGTFVSGYSVFYNYDFGKNYLRNIGLMNVGQGTASATNFNGVGNAQPMIGTGNIWYTLVGYGLPKLSNGTQFAPYVAGTYKKFERLKDASFQFDVGLNYYINAHHAKVTFQYSTRPIYQIATNGDINRSEYRGEFIIQTHIFL